MWEKLHDCSKKKFYFSCKGDWELGHRCGKNERIQNIETIYDEDNEEHTHKKLRKEEEEEDLGVISTFIKHLSIE